MHTVSDDRSRQFCVPGIPREKNKQKKCYYCEKREGGGQSFANLSIGASSKNFENFEISDIDFSFDSTSSCCEVVAGFGVRHHLVVMRQSGLMVLVVSSSTVTGGGGGGGVIITTH